MSDATATATPLTLQPSSVQGKFAQLKETANKTFAERDDVIHLMITAVLARQNFFMLGVPGVAKSAVVRYLLEALFDAEGFEILMSRFTNPEQVFGPLNLKALKEEGKQNTITTGFLPKAHIGFLDEIWKASNAILNNLLTIVNERLFFNGADKEECPLISTFSASNELPQSSELGALYDRFLLKSVVREISNPGTLSGLMGGGSHTPPVKISLKEIEAAHAEIAQITTPKDVLNAVSELVFKLRSEGIQISDRAVIQSAADKNPMTGKPFLSLIKTQAWLEGRSAVTVRDLSVLKHVFWKDPKDQRIVNKYVNQIANPYDQKALEMDETIDQIIADMEKEKKSGKGEITAVSQALSKLKKTGVETARLLSGHTDDPQFSKLKNVHVRIEGLVKSIVAQSMAVASPTDFQNKAPKI
jgi:MoxR-like ATPase